MSDDLSHYFQSGTKAVEVTITRKEYGAEVSARGKNVEAVVAAYITTVNLLGDSEGYAGKPPAMDMKDKERRKWYATQKRKNSSKGFNKPPGS